MVRSGPINKHCVWKCRWVQMHWKFVGFISSNKFHESTHTHNQSISSSNLSINFSNRICLMMRSLVTWGVRPTITSYSRRWQDAISILCVQVSGQHTTIVRLIHTCQAILLIFVTSEVIEMSYEHLEQIHNNTCLGY